jgi:hypothetical protein
MSNMTEALAHEEYIGTFLEPPFVAYRDELLEWESFIPERLIQRLWDMFKTPFTFPPLTGDQINTIKGCLHPKTITRKVEATAESVPEGFELPDDSKVVIPLDIDQQRLARNINGGHRLISGVAGTTGLLGHRKPGDQSQFQCS